MKRWLFLSHRWLGLFGSLLVLLWFLSGIVMMYVHFPRLTEAERLQALPVIDNTGVVVSPSTALATAIAHAGESAGVAQSIRLLQAGDSPIYAIRLSNWGFVAVNAVTGKIVNVDVAQATLGVKRFSSSTISHIEKLTVDQWSVYPGLKPHRPLYAFDTENGGRHYVSSRTGEVVRDTSRFERGWNWVGAVVHWIYVTPIRENGDLWHWVVIVTSGYAIVVALLGTTIGIMRMRRYANGRLSPYHGWWRWHHILGLTTALFVFSWLISGMLSMNPFSVFTRADRTALNDDWRGTALQVQTLPRSAPPIAAGAKEIDWLPFTEGSVATTRFADVSQSFALSSETSERAAERAWTVDHNFVEQRAIKLAAKNNTQIASIRRLDEPDLYYYSRLRQRPLPVWRIELADPAKTWWHIDGTSGEFIGAMDRSNRVERWLYNGLHSWDFAPLLRQRPWSWDVPMLIALIMGTLFSVTSVAIAWKRIRPPRKRQTNTHLREDSRRVSLL